ncbi:MAG: hypothetical protein ACE5H8_02285 [Alphaproteobacteria bacterium]
MRSFSSAICALIVPALAACASSVTATDPVYEVAGLRDIFQHAAAGRDLLTEVRGNPTAAPKAAFDAAVLAAMQGRNGGPVTHFTTAPAADAHTEYRVVLAFAADSVPSARAACGTVGPLAAAGRPAYLKAAFCYRDRALAHLEIAAGAMRSPDDPRLRNAVSLAVGQLFPLSDPDRPTNGGDQFD